MAKKIAILTENREKFGALIEAFELENIEVFISEHALEECEKGDFDFIKQFDQVMLDFEVFQNINPETLHKFEETRIEFTVIHFSSLNGGNQILFSRVYDGPLFIKAVLKNFQQKEMKKMGAYSAFSYDEFPQTSHGWAESSVQGERKFEKQLAYQQKVQNSLKYEDGHFWVNEHFIDFTRKEVEVLHVIMLGGHDLVCNEEIYEAVWGGQFDKSKQPFLSNLVLKIRKKVRDEINIPDSIILNRKGDGYKLNEKFMIL
jgi:DNA-binding response OmpR family regulator